MKNNNKASLAMLTFLFASIVFFIITFTVIIVGAIIFLLVEYGIIQNNTSRPNIFIPIIIFAISSIVVGTFLTLAISRIPLKPIKILIDGMKSLETGNYKTRIHIGNQKTAYELSESFNKLAVELENTEILRSDFINNFSHEFKTPMVSILGFTKLIRRGNLSDEQKDEYLAIIEEESARLVEMSSNILDMTKIENQNILTGTSRYNLSEQIRTCVLLFEKKWEEKSIVISLDFDEYYIDANEDMMREVFINIISNAVKFTPENGEIDIKIRKNDDTFDITVKNTGSEIDEKSMPRIFDKFYQGDTSHSTQGSGLGLSIAKKITELHGGSIKAKSENMTTSFTVSIPSRRE